MESKSGLAALAGAKLGAAPGIGTSGNNSTNGWWRSAPIREIIAFSPQVALARYYSIPFAPFVQSITATFSSSTGVIGPFALGQNANDRLSIVSVVDAMVYDVQPPNYNAGNGAQGFLNWWWARQTGIQATLDIDGTPRYVVAPDYTPIDTLCAMMTEMWPSGWVLNYTQSPKMQFQTTVALPSTPVTITVSFRMWQPVAVRRMLGLTDARAIELLAQAGVITADEASAFVSNC
jgi:hypothetical protein